MQATRTNEELAEKLLQCLDIELALSEQLLELSKEQQQALIKRLDDKVETISAAQDAKLRQLSSARKRSQVAGTALAESLNMESEEPALNELASVMEEPYASRIDGMIIKLVKAASSLYEQNIINRNLLVGAVQYVSFCLRLLSGGDEQVQYKPGSSVRTRPNALILDQTV